jgi:hypothetical protein
MVGVNGKTGIGNLRHDTLDAIGNIEFNTNRNL